MKRNLIQRTGKFLNNVLDWTDSVGIQFTVGSLRCSDNWIVTCTHWKRELSPVGWHWVYQPLWDRPHGQEELTNIKQRMDSTRVVVVLVLCVSLWLQFGSVRGRRLTWSYFVFLTEGVAVVLSFCLIFEKELKVVRMKRTIWSKYI